MRNISLSFHLWVDDDHAFEDEKNSNPEEFEDEKNWSIRNSSKTANSSKRRLRVRRQKNSSRSGTGHSRVVWRTFSIRKWGVNVFKANEFSIGKWRVNVFKATSFREDFISEKIGYSGERFQSGNEEWMYSKPLVSEKTTSFQREDWLWRTFSIGKWRVNVFIISEKIGTLENVFVREMKSECIQTYYWLAKRLWVSFQIRTFSFGKIKSECIQSHEFQRRLHFNKDWLLENVFDREMKSECFHHFRED